VKLTTGVENFKGVVSDDLSFASVEIDKNYWLTLPRWKSLCHRLSRYKPPPGSFFQQPREAEKREPGNKAEQLVEHKLCLAHGCATHKKKTGVILHPSFPITATSLPFLHLQGGQFVEV